MIDYTKTKLLIISLLTSIMSILFGILLYYYKGIHSNIFTSIIDLGSLIIYSFIIMMIMVMVFYLFVVIRTINKNYSPFKISIVGQPNSGKTVYLTIVFDRLQYYQNNNIRFFPYGRETIEQVGSDLNILYSGKWLKPTSKESLFFYRANVVSGKSFLSRKYTVEIADYAGEYIKEFESSSDLWLHRTDYFKHVITSDGVFLAVDGNIIKDGDISRIQEMQNNLIAAFQVMVDEKGVPADRKLRSPVALLILKSDIFFNDFNYSDDKILDSIGRLITVCRTKCRRFRVFFVSSVGKVNSDGSPPTEINPHNVCEPMIWLLRHGK